MTLNVTREHDGALVLLSFDHGRANEMGRAELAALERLASELEADPAAVVLVSTSRRLTSKGTPVFVAGANVTERVGWSDADVKAHVAWQRSVLGRIRHLPVFHICVVGGMALGWGTEWLLTADWRIAADEAVFGLPETGLGILPGAGGTAELWAHIGVPMALRLGMTGARVSPDEALSIGLVQERVADIDAGLERAWAMAAQVATRSPSANAAFKRALLAAVGQPPAVRQQLEAAAYDRCVDLGEAAIGRARFGREGGLTPWGPKRVN